MNTIYGGRNSIIKEQTLKLRCGTYKESVLVDKVCTEAQQKSYHKKEKFASGKYQSMFLDTLSRYCDYEYDMETKKYTILEVYKYPKLLYDSKIHKGIYQYIAPLILNEVLYGEGYEERKAVLTSIDFAKTIDLVNPNYDKMKYNQDAAQKDMDFSANVLSEYFNKADNRIDEYIRRCIKYLAAMNCVIYNEVHMIGIMPKKAIIENGHVIIEPAKIKRATDSEMKLYSKLVERASRKAKIVTDSEKWYGNKAAKYNTELTRLLKENNIIFVCRAFELWRVDEIRCKEILQSFEDRSIDQCRTEIGMILKLVMDKNAENRFEKNKNLGSNYIEQFKRLSDITLLFGAEDVMKSLPSAKKKDYQEQMKDKYGYEIEYGVGGNRDGAE